MRRLADRHGLIGSFGTLEKIAGAAIGFVAEAAAELGTQLLFSRPLARYFHGIGRRVIFVSTLGRKRIPSCLRIVPKGTIARPRRSDWLALFVGIFTWIAGASAVVAAFLLT